jgi:adenine-specific DNA-methyltransferase
MERRLLVARELLNPSDSVLIVTIDEKEYLRLGLLLEQTFPEARIQMVSITISPRSTSRANEFSRVMALPEKNTALPCAWFATETILSGLC